MLTKPRPSPLLWPTFWVLAGGFYVWFFGRDADSYLSILDLAVPLLLIAMGTAWTLGSVLVPRFLLKGRYGLFALFTGYTVIFSVYLVLAVVVGVFMASGYSMGRMAPAALDRPALVVGVFVVVAMALVVYLVLHWLELKDREDHLASAKLLSDKRLQEAEATLRAMSTDEAFVEIQVDRRTVRLEPSQIRYLEAAADYVLIALPEERLITKARLGELAEQLLPYGFLRVHRSFVVRVGAIDSFSASELKVGDDVIPVSRTYRGEVRGALTGGG